MPEEYGPLKLKVPKGKGDGAKAPQAFKDFADSILKPATAAKSQLAIVQSDGSIVYKTIKGDANLEQDGTLTLTPSSVGSSEVVDGSLTDSDLASPNNSAYRTMAQGTGVYESEKEGTRYFLQNGTLQTISLLLGGIAILFYFAKADYEVAGKTQKLRMRAQQITSEAGPGTTLTVGMYPVTAVGAGLLTLGSVITGSTVAFASTAAKTLAQGNSGDFAIPSDGYYIFGVTNSGKTATSSQQTLSFQLQTHSV